MNGRYMVCSVVFSVLYRGMRVLVHADERVAAELASLPEGRGVRFKVCADPKAPELFFRVENGTVVKEKDKNKKPDLDIIFKNEKMAFRVFTGRMGIPQAYAAHAFTMRGSIQETMVICRIVDIVEGYLFPWIIAKHIMKEKPTKKCPSILVYLRLIPGK